MEEISKAWRIGASGDLNLPLVGRVKAAGLTAEELETEISARLKEYVRNPQVTVFVSDFKSHPVTVSGAVETVDACLGRIETAVKRTGGAMIVTADHGNAEQMIDPATGGPHTAHTTNPVPIILIADTSSQFTLRPDGALQDISPTILGLLHVPQPGDMKGHDLRVVRK